MEIEKEMVIYEGQGKRWLIGADQIELYEDGQLTGRLGLLPQGEKDLSIGPWDKDEGSWVASLTGMAGKMVIERKYDCLCYRLESSESFIPSLTLFPQSQIKATEWQTFLFNEQDRRWDIDVNVSVEVASALDNSPLGPDHGGLLDPADIPGNWLPNIPPRVAAFELENGKWLGLSIPGPLPVGSTWFHWKDGRFWLEFDYLRPGCEEGTMPEVYFSFDHPNAESVLETHAEINKKKGFWRDRKDHPSWWSLPYWALLDDLLAISTHKREGRLNPPPPEESPLTPHQVKEWVSQAKAITGLDEFFLVFDQVYFARYGDFQPIPPLGGTEGFRRLIDELRHEGVRVGLFFNPFKTDLSIPMIKDHPDWISKRTVEGENKHLSSGPTRPGMVCGALDWTHPDAREYMLERVRYLLSNEEGCLNADWICTHNNKPPDPRKHGLHDPDWGVGDLMAHKVRREVYEAAKKAKSDALVRFICVDSYVQPYVDRTYINEDWTPTCDNWFKMAHIVTRTLPGTLLDVTGWFITMTKAKEFWTVMPAFGIAGNYPMNHFIHPYRHYRQARDRDHRRWRGSFQVYVNAPMTADQERRLDYKAGDVYAHRKYTSGPLQGFTAARTFGRRCYATYSLEEARIMATEERWVNLPLPQGAEVETVEEILHSGGSRPYDHEIIMDGSRSVRLLVKDSGDEAVYYRIKYKLD